MIDILGIKLNNFDKKQAKKQVMGFLNTKKQYTIFTPNPEMVVDAQNDEYFRDILNTGDLNICDGFGLSLISKFKIKRISGVDFMQDILYIAEKQNKSVYFLGSGNSDVIKNLILNVQQKYPTLNIVGNHIGLKIKQLKVDKRYILIMDEKENDDIIGDIIMREPDILFVAFGHGKQEKWIYENIIHIPSVRIAMGVGGSFDFLSGKIKRSPKFLRIIGLEWLYRLILEPKRYKRIWKATIIFLYYYIKSFYGKTFENKT